MITEEEKQARADAAKYALASVGLEGITLSDELLKIVDKFVIGDLTLEEFNHQYDLALDQGL